MRTDGLSIAASDSECGLVLNREQRSGRSGDAVIRRHDGVVPIGSRRGHGHVKLIQSGRNQTSKLYRRGRSTYLD